MTPAADAKLHSRLLGAVLGFELAKDMITSGFWVLQPESLMGRIAMLSSFPTVFGYLWMSLSVCVAPYFVMQATNYGRAYCREVIRLACWAILASGVFWTYLAYLSKNLDYGYATVVFLICAASCIAMSAVLAHGLNATLPDCPCDGVAA